MRKKSRFFNRLPEANAMPGAKELLKQVKGAGLIPVLVTGSGQRSLLGRLNCESRVYFHRSYGYCI